MKYYKVRVRPNGETKGLGIINQIILAKSARHVELLFGQAYGWDYIIDVELLDNGKEY